MDVDQVLVVGSSGSGAGRTSKWCTLQEAGAVARDLVRGGCTAVELVAYSAGAVVARQPYTPEPESEGAAG